MSVNIEAHNKSIDRALEMASHFEAGKTLAEIGEMYGGISRERVRQLLKKVGVTGKDGGHSVRPNSHYGLSKEEYLRFVDQFPGCREAFRQQRQSARMRGVEWRLTFRDWIGLWDGKWDQRGRGRGLVMCRHKDKGAYEIGNVFIASGVFNNTAYAMRRWHGIDIEDDPYYADMR